MSSFLVKMKKLNTIAYRMGCPSCIYPAKNSRTKLSKSQLEFIREVRDARNEVKVNPEIKQKF